MITALLNPIGHRAFEQALQSGRGWPAPRPKADSRIADKFVLRGFSELFSELASIGAYHGRSTNSEMIAGVLEAITGFERANAMLRIFKRNLGEEMTDRVLADVPTLNLSECKQPDRFVIRFPPDVRDTIRDDVQRILKTEEDGGPFSMNQWLLNVLVVWVGIQHQLYALLNAEIANSR